MVQSASRFAVLNSQLSLVMRSISGILTILAPCNTAGHVADKVRDAMYVRVARAHTCSLRQSVVRELGLFRLLQTGRNCCLCGIASMIPLASCYFGAEIRGSVMSRPLWEVRAISAPAFALDTVSCKGVFVLLALPSVF